MSTIGAIALVTLLSGGHADSSPSVRLCGPGSDRSTMISCFFREGVMANCDAKAMESSAEQQQIQEELQRRADELRRKLERSDPYDGSR
jgi:hypothetical protein